MVITIELLTLFGRYFMLSSIVGEIIILATYFSKKILHLFLLEPNISNLNKANYQQLISYILILLLEFFPKLCHQMRFSTYSPLSV